MGTNYYWESSAEPPCSKCNRPYEKKIQHIGKSSAGWVFALHVYPEKGIKDLPDWYDLWQTPGTVIKNECGDILSPDKMLAIVLARFGMRNHPEQNQEFYSQNQAERGPYGLARARLNARVIGHGVGTYSLHLGSEESW